jgi:hypothetical protein
MKLTQASLRDEDWTAQSNATCPVVAIAKMED